MAVAPMQQPMFYFRNYEMDKGLGHMDYREKMLEIAEKIKLEQ